MVQLVTPNTNSVALIDQSFRRGRRWFEIDTCVDPLTSQFVVGLPGQQQTDWKDIAFFLSSCTSQEIGVIVHLHLPLVSSLADYARLAQKASYILLQLQVSGVEHRVLRCATSAFWEVYPVAVNQDLQVETARATSLDVDTAQGRSFAIVQPATLGELAQLAILALVRGHSALIEPLQSNFPGMESRDFPHAAPRDSLLIAA